MEESAFNALAEAELARIESALEDCGVDLDIEPKPGGILELEFDNGTKMIINRHTAAREIWVAAKSGGFHFRPQDGQWVNTRDGADLWAMLSRLVGEQAGEPVQLARADGSRPGPERSGPALRAQRRMGVGMRSSTGAGA